MGILLFVGIFISFVASAEATSLLSCSSQQFPNVHLSVEISELEGLWSGKYILMVNLTEPEERANTRIADIFSSPMEGNAVTISESYIHGIQLKHTNHWQAEVQIFEIEKPILLSCH